MINTLAKGTRQKRCIASLVGPSYVFVFLASLVGPSYVFVFLEEIFQNWSFFSLREHFSGANMVVRTLGFRLRLRLRPDRFRLRLRLRPDRLLPASCVALRAMTGQDDPTGWDSQSSMVKQEIKEIVHVIDSHRILTGIGDIHKIITFIIYYTIIHCFPQKGMYGYYPE